MKERIENLKKQQEQARELFIKCQGAIEMLEGCLLYTSDAADE